MEIHYIPIAHLIPIGHMEGTQEFQVTSGKKVSIGRTAEEEIVFHEGNKNFFFSFLFFLFFLLKYQTFLKVLLVSPLELFLELMLNYGSLVEVSI